MKLSIIITAHDEGILAHKTMLSVFRALENFDDGFEIIVHIDKGTVETERYFERYKDDGRFRIFKNQFGDLGESRNFAIKEAHGKFISLLDADDLVSENYFVEMIKTLNEAKEEIVVHPNYCLSFEDFGSHYCFQTLGESISPEMDAFLLFSRHRWVAAISAKKSTLVNHSYISTKDGFGCEDYTLSIELTNSKILHKVAKGTVYFYRRKEFSLLKQSNSQHCTQPYSELFDIEKWKKLKIPEDDMAEQSVGKEQKLRDTYVRIRNNKFLNFFITPAAELAKKVTGKKLIQNTKVPTEVLKEWKEVSKIEMQIYPAQYIIDAMTVYDTDTPNEVSKAYRKLCKQVEVMPDFVFIVPWVISGGADKVLLNYLKAIKEIHPEWKVAVIAMLKSDNEWKYKIADNSFLVEFGNVIDNLCPEDRELLFTRLLMQLKCSRIHIIHSVDALHWIKYHAALVKKNFDITISLFCHGIIPGTNGEGVWDFADPHVIRIYPLINKIYTDNNSVVKKLVEMDGFDKEKIVVHYQPTPLVKHKKREYSSERSLKILWAGRISVQKNPTLLVKIAEKLNPEKVQIDAYGRVDLAELEGFKFPKNSKVLHYKGPFQSFDDIDLDQYDVLLHTSRIDGMPNVILEAAAAGLVPIASNVGGISDFVRNGETGFLIDDVLNEDAYVKIINQIQKNPGQLSSLADGAQKLLEKQYSWKSYIKQLKSEF